jgi:flagellar protein FliS
MFASAATGSASAYKKVGVETGVDRASPHELVTMLFDGLLLAIASARGALERGDIKTKGQQIGVAVRILEEGLKGALNLDEGGALAANLQTLYAYCVVRLTQANARNDEAALREVAHLIEPVAGSWKQISPADMAALQAA